MIFSIISAKYELNWNLLVRVQRIFSDNRCDIERKQEANYYAIVDSWIWISDVLWRVNGYSVKGINRLVKKNEDCRRRQWQVYFHWFSDSGLILWPKHSILISWKEKSMQFDSVHIRVHVIHCFLYVYCSSCVNAALKYSEP